MGDGIYFTYIGRTAGDQITSFVTDFNVPPTPDERHDSGTNDRH